MKRYAQIDENGLVVSDSYLTGEVIADNMIPIPEGFDLTHKKYVNGEWVGYTPKPMAEPILEVTEQEVINADILLAQAEQTAKLKAIDEALAVILLNITGGDARV